MSDLDRDILRMSMARVEDVLGAQWSPLLGDQEVLELSPEPWLGVKQTETGRRHCR